MTNQFIRFSCMLLGKRSASTDPHKTPIAFAFDMASKFVVLLKAYLDQNHPSDNSPEFQFFKFYQLKNSVEVRSCNTLR